MIVPSTLVPGGASPDAPVMDFQTAFGVSLNGRPARAGVTARGQIEIVSADDRAVFNLSTASMVIHKMGGRFETLELRRIPCA